MKLKNILIAFAVVLSSLFVTTVNAESAPGSLTFNSNNTPVLYGSTYLGHDSTIHMAYKQATNGKVTYCTEIHDNWFYSGSHTFYKGNVLSAKFAYVMLNGYPNKSITGDKYKDYFITGLAIWYLTVPNDSTFTYIDLNAGTYKGYESDVIKEVAKLVKGALNYSYTEPVLTINNPNKFTLSSDGKYYVSSEINTSNAGTTGTFTVGTRNAPEGTVITDTNGNVKATFDKYASFIVKVPVSSIKELSNSFEVVVTANSEIYKAYVYNPTNSSYQSVTTLYPETKDLEDVTTMNLDIITRVEISKQDATTGEELPGATLVLKCPDGSEITWVSTNEPKVIENLEPGKYYLTETIAPEGYILSTETVTFEIKLDGTVEKVVMKNYPKNDVYISKQDATTGEELPGATLVLKNEKGEVVDEWVSGDTPHKVKVKLSAGKYYLTETIAPDGYKLSTETVTFTVEKDGTVKEPVVMLNYPEKPNTVYISKQDATTGEELPGAYLEIKNENGVIVEAWISTNTPYMVEGLEPGKYYLTETIAPDGYELSSEVVEFIVKEDGTVDGIVIMYNSREIVEVPSTSSFKTITASLIGVIVIGLGAMIIYKNYKKNEEI